MKVRRRAVSAAVAAVLALLALTGHSAVGWGDRGEEVTRVQQRLKQYGYYDGVVDGVFGQETYAAVLWFQRKNGLTADGVAGSATLAALGLSASQPVAATGDSEVYMLARLVHG